MKVDVLSGAWILESMARGGVNIENLSARVPDELEQMLHHPDIVDIDTINLVLIDCAKLSNNPDFGLCMNEYVDISMYGILGYLLLNSATVAELFEHLQVYYTLLNSGGGFYKEERKNNLVSIQFESYQKLKVYPRHGIDWSLGFIAYYLQSELGHGLKPVKAQFSYSRPENIDKLESIFGLNLIFNQKTNKIFYPQGILHQKLTDFEPGLLHILREQADKLIYSCLKENKLEQKIKLMLMEKIEFGNASEQMIANQLNYSISSFKRKLNEENINFRQLKESVKNKLAQKMLIQTKARISHIARKIGFSDQSSFTRFFIRCNQVRPLEYRNKDNT